MATAVSEDKTTEKHVDHPSHASSSFNPFERPDAPRHAYSQYGYSHGSTSSQSVPPGSGSVDSTVLPPPGMHQRGMVQGYPTGMDTTGQMAPPGMKPRVTATLWEDEGSLCFQVEARGICVARREDNHMINGTKLLNVAGMTRSRRDGVLKNEKVRHVVKIGPMHLKGVWIPFERALDFANKEKITEMLYPLFVHNIGALLYHPTNQTRTNQVMAAAERRKLETRSNSQMSHSGPAMIASKPEPTLEHDHSKALPHQQLIAPASNIKTADYQQYPTQSTANSILHTDPVGLPVSPTASAVSGHDEPSSRKQSGSSKLEWNSVDEQEAEILDSWREGSTKTRTFTAKGEPKNIEDDPFAYVKNHIVSQSHSTSRSGTIGMSNYDGMPETSGENNAANTQVDNLSPSQNSPQSNSEHSSDSETGLLTRNERRDILIERLMAYFFELLSSCSSPVPNTTAESPMMPNINNRRHPVEDECAPPPLPPPRYPIDNQGPLRLPHPRRQLQNHQPMEDECAPPPLPPPRYPMDDEQALLRLPRSNSALRNNQPGVIDLNYDKYHQYNDQYDSPMQDGLDSVAGQSKISATSESKQSNASCSSTKPMQKRDRGKEDDDKDERPPNKRPRMNDDKYTATKRLACPYFKNDPAHPGLGRSCSGPGWGTVHRIKEHLDRNHALPPSCVRYYMAFESEADRDTHVRLQDQCQLKERPGRICGFDVVQKEQLRSRPKGYKHMSETQKWCHMYMILFPETLATDVPSPFYEFGSLRDSGHPVDPMIEYENFLRHEMPDRVRQQLELRIEEALNPLEETLRGQIVDIVRNVQLELFQTFRASTGHMRPNSDPIDNPERTGNEELGDNHVRESTVVPINEDPPSRVNWDQSSWEDQMQAYQPVPPLDFSFTEFDGELFDFGSLMNIPAARDSTYGTLSMSQAETDKDDFIWNETSM